MKKSFILFFVLSLFVTSIISQEKQAPKAKTVKSKKTVKKAPETPQAAPTEPTAEAAAPTQAQPAKTPDQTPAAQPQTEGTPQTQEASSPAPTTPPTPPVEFEQRTWESNEAVELEKEEPMPAANNENFKNSTDQAKEINRKIQETVDQILKTKAECYEKHGQVNAQLDSFLQEMSLLQGEFKNKIEQAKDKNPALEQYKKDWEQLNADVEKTDSLENKLLEQLKKLDEKINEILELSTNARTLNSEILQATNESDLLNKLNQLKEIQNKVTTAQKTEIENFSKQIEQLANQLPTNMQTIREAAQKLEEKGKTIRLVEEPQIKKEESTQKKTEKAAPEEKRYLYNATVRACAWFVKFISDVKDWFISLFTKKEAEPAKTTEGKTEAAQAPIKDEKAIDAKPQEPEKIKVEKQDPKENSQPKPEQAQEATNAIQATEQKQENATWRAKAEYAFGKFLDGITWLVEKTKYYSKKLYDTYAKDKITNFVTDVQARITEIEKAKEAPKENLQTNPSA